MNLGALGPFESQLVLLPLLIVVVVGLFALVISDLEVVLRRQLGEDVDEEIGATILSFPKARGRRRRGGRRQPGVDANDLQRALLERARERSAS